VLSRLRVSPGAVGFPDLIGFAHPYWINAGLFFRFIDVVCFPLGSIVLPTIYTNEDFENFLATSRLTNLTYCAPVSFLFYRQLLHSLHVQLRPRTTTATAHARSTEMQEVRGHTRPCKGNSYNRSTRTVETLWQKPRQICSVQRR
jgi:hypothetical protein